MELFSEIYSSYYRAVEAVLCKAQKKPLSSEEIQKTLSDYAFSESIFTILPKLQSGIWPLLRKTESGYTAACAPLPENPLSDLQKSWLLAILNDPRIRLFFDSTELDALRQSLPNVDPLYRQKDFYLFDEALDSDDYEDPDYQNRFRTILAAIRGKSALSIQYEGGKGRRVNGVFWPLKLEFSQKDDKLRAHCYRKTGNRKVLYTLNLGRIKSIEPARQILTETEMDHFNPTPRFRLVILEISKERNALERSMVQFAHFEKRTEYNESTDKYICTIRYNVMDETELVIRVLSFGPTVRVLGPETFIQEIRSRVQKQYMLIT